MKLSRIALQAFITGFSGAAMPGPVLAAVIVLTIATGFSAGPLVVFGHFLLEVVLVLAIAAGLHRYLSRPDAPLVRAIGLVGGAVLLLMAYDMLRSLPQLSLAAVATEQLPYGPITAGFVLSAANPYFWIWWATIGLGLLTESLAQRSRPGLAAFYLGHILADLAWYSLVSGLISGGRSLLGDGTYRALLAVCAAMLVVFGVRFVWFSLHPAVPAVADDG